MMNHFALELMAMETHRAHLAEADRRRRDRQLRRPDASRQLPQVRWRLFRVARRNGLQPT